MANAKKCDVCGKYYSELATPDITVTNYHHPYGDTRYDLCDECQKKLEMWLNKKVDKLC